MPTYQKSPEKKRDIRLELADRLIEQMEKGEARWQKPWTAGDFQAPINAVTGKPYRGVNYEMLTTFSPDNSDPRWMTLKQANEQGYRIRKGSHGVPIEVWKQYEAKRTPEQIEAIKAAREDPKNNKVKEGEIEETEQRVMVKYYTVFHASQIEGIPPLERPAVERPTGFGEIDPRLDGLAKNMGVPVTHDGSKAYYRPSTDSVHIPPVERFESAVAHDTVLLHELSHATGAEKRMNRDLTGGFGTEKYAQEELRAEMAAAMTAAQLGIGWNPDAQRLEEGREQNTAAYLAGWLKALPDKERKQTVMQAIKDAQAISDYLIERTPEIQHTAEVAQSIDKDQKLYKALSLTNVKSQPMVARTDPPYFVKEMRDRGINTDGYEGSITLPAEKITGRLIATDGYNLLLVDTKEHGLVEVNLNAPKMLWNNEKGFRDLMQEAKEGQHDITLAIKNNREVSATDHQTGKVASYDSGIEPMVPWGLTSAEESFKIVRAGEKVRGGIDRESIITYLNIPNRDVDKFVQQQIAAHEKAAEVSRPHIARPEKTRGKDRGIGL